MLEKLELFLYARADRIVLLTEAFKKNLADRGVPVDKMSVVINGVDLTRYQPCSRDYVFVKQHNIATDQLIIGYLGTHGMAHGLMNVLHAATLLQHENILFLFVGAGAERNDLMNYAQAHHIKNVKFLPAQPKAVMTKWWGLCDVALVHLKNDAVFAEVIPSKIFEAMGMGLPILLAAPKGVASDIVISNDVGLWVPASNPDELAKAAVRLTDANLRGKFAANSKARAHLYSREKQAQAMLLQIEKTCFAVG